MPGTINCRCGKVSIKVTNQEPRFRLQCGCCDCRQAGQWAQLQGGPEVPSQPLDAWYFLNDVEVSDGKDQLKWYKLRTDGTVIHISNLSTIYFKTKIISDLHNI